MPATIKSNLLHPTLCTFVILGFLTVTTSCKKEMRPGTGINNTSTNEVSVSNAASCQPIVFGATVTYPGSGLPKRWVTLMQKWYGQNGKPTFLKARFYTEMNDFSMLEHAIEWGMLTYPNNNQVYLKDADEVTMRVTVDAQQRPAASYYFHNHFPKGTFLADTCYYHFNGNRLDAVERLYSTDPSLHSQFEKFNFFYDGFGNVARIDRWKEFSNTTS